MARRRNLIDDDHSDSSDASNEDDDDGADYQGHDPDREAEEDLFRDPYQTGKKRRRGHGGGKEDAIYGTFAHDSDDDAPAPRGGGSGGGRGRGRGGSNARLRRPQAFVSSSSKVATNPIEDPQPLATVDAHAGPTTIDNDDAMDVSSDSGSDSGSGSASEDNPKSDHPAAASDSTSAALPRSGLGLGATASPAGSANYAAAQMFAKAGLGAGAGAGSATKGLGAGRAGGRVGLGGAGAGGRVGLGGGGLGMGMGQKSVRQLMEEGKEPAGTSGSKSASPIASGSNTPTLDPSSLPARRAFLGAQPTPGTSTSNAIPEKPKVSLSRQEQQHFAQLSSSNSKGLKMLAAMGWKAGTGLGQKGEGIVTPIESKLRPKGAGLNFDGFKERTKQAEEEDRRKGKLPLDDDEEDGGGKGRRGKKGKKGLDLSRTETPEPRIAAWKRGAPRKPTTVHKTYEELLAAAGTEHSVDSGIGQIVDLTGKTLPSLPSTLSLANGEEFEGPTGEEKKLPELRHNLGLLQATAKGEVIALAKEGKAVAERKRWTQGEAERAQKLAAEETQKMNRFEKVLQAVGSAVEVGKVVGGKDAEFEELLAEVGEGMEKDGGLMEWIGIEGVWEEMRLDEVVVAALAPVLRRAWAQWQPLDDPTFLVPQLKRWRKAFRLQKDTDLENDQQFNDFGSLAAPSRAPQARTTMTAFESLLWTQWLPRIRSAANAWDPAKEAGKMVDLYVAWEPLLPRFLRDNFFDQLVLPKVSTTMSEWSPPKGSSTEPGRASLFAIVFPWLEHAGEARMEEILDQAKRKIRSWLGKSWRVKDGVPEELEMWRAVFSNKDWDALMLKAVVPLLGSYLRDHFKVDPRQQDMVPLQRIFPWRTLLRRSIFSQLLETEFFGKWLETLWVWLTHGPDYGQVTKWYTWWKGQVPGDVGKYEGWSKDSSGGLEMVHQAQSLESLGLPVKERLQRPDLVAKPLSSSSSSASASSRDKTAAGKARKPPRQVQEVTFRSIVEEEAAKENLILLPTGKSLEATGQQLLRVSKGVDGKNGLTIYIEDDVVYVQDGKEWEPMMVEEMLAMAKAR